MVMVLKGLKPRSTQKNSHQRIRRLCIRPVYHLLPPCNYQMSRHCLHYVVGSQASLVKLLGLIIPSKKCRCALANIVIFNSEQNANTGVQK